MARYRPKGLGLERVLGVGALFSAAYGNVGSSIYYALGLAAAFAPRPPAARYPQPRGRRALLGGVRERRLVDLLRARPGRSLRARPHAGRLPDRGRALRDDRDD